MRLYHSVLVSLILSVLFISCRDGLDIVTSEGDLDDAPPVTIIRISSPAEGSIWEPGTIQNINWRINSEVRNVRIELVKKFNFVFTISHSSPNDGVFLWDIPEEIAQSHHYRIKIINTADEEEFKYSGEFFIPQS